MTTTDPDTARGTPLIEQWFPVAAVDEACGNPAGSGQNEKAIFTWFASRPIAQARAAVLCSLLREPAGGDDEARKLVAEAVLRGAPDVLDALSQRITAEAVSPVVLDCFSGRGIIPLEAARLGLRAVGIDLSPVAVLASRLLAEWPLRDWSSEPDLTMPADASQADDEEEDEPEARLLVVETEPKLIRDLRAFFAQVGLRLEQALTPCYPKNPDGTYPWGYLWAVTIPCDECHRRFPLVGSLVLRNPYRVTGDPGQSLEVGTEGDRWVVHVHDGSPTGQPTMAAAPGRRGKSARCPFPECRHVHPLDTVKAKGFAGQYEDAPLVAADLAKVQIIDTSGRKRSVERKTFRTLRDDERAAALGVDLSRLAPFGDLPAAPTEEIAPGNASTIDATGYGFRTFASLMNARQVLLFVETVRAIRATHRAAIDDGVSPDYAAALAAYAGANLVRRLRRATRGAKLEARGKPSGDQQNRNHTADVFANESGVMFAFDWFETGPGMGPGTWASLTETTLRPLATHVSGITRLASPGKFRRASATSLPYRDQTVDAVVVDPPYYEMINYADVSDVFYVWLRRCLFDILPDLFGAAGDTRGLQDKSHEIIVKQGRASDDHRTADWYETTLSEAFEEMRRVLKKDGVLTVVFGHSDPAAWRRLLGALRDAGFVVASAWPARTESGNTGVASIKVTVTIGCRVAPIDRRSATAAQVEREITDLIRTRVKQWDEWGLALSDQLMASYGPAMQVVGQYRTIQRPDGSEPELDHFLTVGRRAVGDAHAFKVDELPLDTFDALTRFAIFWLRAFGRTAVNKGEAVFHAQTSQMRIDDIRPSLVVEAKGGLALTLDPPPSVNERSPVIDIVRALAAAWPRGGTEAAAKVMADAVRSPDDSHLWATVAELVRQLPESDKVAMALTACQRNRRPIETSTRQHAPATGEQLTLDTEGIR
jgi:adenine-specific DNA methylase